MKRAVIWGAGQGGRMIGNLLHGDISIAAYCDMNDKKWGTTLAGVPIVGPDALAELAPDLVVISMLNTEACTHVQARLVDMGINTEVVTAMELRDTYDLRLATMKLCAGEVHEREIPGAIAELGVYQGAFSAELNRLFPERSIYLFDTFSGFDQRDLSIEHHEGYSRAAMGNFEDTSTDLVRRRLPYPEKAVFRVGYFPETAQGLEEHFALVSLDADLYKPLYDGLTYFYPLMSSGGYLIIHDYNNTRFSGAKEAVRKFCTEQQVFLVPLPDLHGTAVIVKP